MLDKEIVRTKKKSHDAYAHGQTEESSPTWKPEPEAEHCSSSYSQLD
jgi:hypothetical protein